ncbi:hypothetical protein Lal_00023141, partial [Lupinus albus]
MSTKQVTSMGGPLAGALRSSTSTSSPTSVLHQLPRSSASETSFITRELVTTSMPLRSHIHPKTCHHGLTSTGSALSARAYTTAVLEGAYTRKDRDKYISQQSSARLTETPKRWEYKM